MGSKKAYVFSLSKTLKTYEKQNGRCAYCYKKFEYFSNHPQSPSWDHIIARSEGGKNNEENVILSCNRCNSLKGSIPMDRFLDGYIWKHVSSRSLGLPDDAPGKTIEVKVRGKRRWYHKFIGYSY